MKEEIQQEVLEMLQALAKQLGVGVEALWEIYVRQAYFSGLIWAGLFILLTIILLIITITAYKFYLKDKKENGDFFGWMVLIDFVYSIFFMFMLHTNVMKIINPEYYAFTNLIGTF